MAQKKKTKVCYKEPKAFPSAPKSGGKISHILNFDDAQSTTASNFIGAGDPTIIFGDGHIPMDITRIRVISKQIQIGGKYRYDDNKEVHEYEQISMINSEYYNNVIFEHLHDLDELGIKVFRDSYLRSMEVSENYNVDFAENEIVNHKPLPYFKRGQLVYPPIGKAKITKINLIEYINDTNPQIEIEAYEHKDWNGGHTYIHQIRSLSEPTEDWDVSFAAFICAKLEQSLKFRIFAYLNSHCLDINLLPPYLQQGSSFFGNKASYLRFKPILDTEPGDEVHYHFLDIMDTLGRKGINERMYADIGGGQIQCSHSKQQLEFGVYLNNCLFDCILKTQYLETNDIQLQTGYHGYNKIFETTLDASGWLADLLGESNLTRAFKAGTVAEISRIEPIICSYNTKSSTLIIKSFKFKICV
eukprot:438882_1